MTMQQTYPIQSLAPASTQEDIQKALEATIQQLIQEGASPEDASAQAGQMLQQIQSQIASAEIPRKTSTDMSQAVMNPNSRFARGAGGQGMNSTGPSQAYNSVQNPWFTNWNPTTIGGYSNR
jgi:hypothetical protein